MKWFITSKVFLFNCDIYLTRQLCSRFFFSVFIVRIREDHFIKILKANTGNPSIYQSMSPRNNQMQIVDDIACSVINTSYCLLSRWITISSKSLSYLRGTLFILVIWQNPLINCYCWENNLYSSFMHHIGHCGIKTLCLSNFLSWELNFYVLTILNWIRFRIVSARISHFLLVTVALS